MCVNILLEKILKTLLFQDLDRRGVDLSEFDAFTTRMNDLIFRPDFFAFFVKTDCKFGNTRLICLRGICLIGGFHLICSSIAYDYFVILSIAKTLFNWNITPSPLYYFHFSRTRKYFKSCIFWSQNLKFDQNWWRR